MSHFVGIDFGSAMVKCAVIDSPTGTPQTLYLSDVDPLFPVIASVTSQGLRVDPHDYWTRRSRSFETAFAFRDRILPSGAPLRIGGQEVAATELLRELFNAIAVAIESSGIQATQIGMTVPDAWRQVPKALTDALNASRLRVTLLIPESFAAFAMLDGLTGHDVLFVSHGFSAWQRSLLKADHSHWMIVQTHHDVLGGGANLRRRLFAAFSRRIIEEWRIDPTEEPALGQDLDDAIESMLRILQTSDAARGEVTWRGSTTAIMLCRSEEEWHFLADRGPSWSVMDEMHDDRTKPHAVVLWGELAASGPLVDRYAKARIRVHALSLDSVAAGASRLVARSDLMADSRTATTPHSRIPLLTRLPTAQRQGPTWWLVWERTNAPEQRVEMFFPFRVGRSPSAELSFADDEFPIVSFDHAEFRLDGDELVVRDLRSSNGTFVNGERIDRRRIKTGERVQLGRTGPRLRVECHT